ncbi:XTP/dITP diphosphatase [Fundicoccus culcitae]|uniref:dITP/XTP pyrophosphatase n=1 Tax=Fundicoccus culcitae TaxID=2969821 RepID=A0ABY5P704_9LACT|nr:XTP/dITP diphosphatase [Fundicoccus culcitae]
MKLIIASHNKGKITEFTNYLTPLGFEVSSLLDYPQIQEVEEIGQTFEENARLKAETMAEAMQVFTLADDSGLVVPSLNGEPGIYSARYGGEEKDDTANNEKLLKNLVNKSRQQRQAYFVSCLVLAYPGVPSLVAHGQIKGEIITEYRGKNGFGYDPIFYVEEKGQTLAEMTLEEKNQGSHRALALDNLIKNIPVWLEELGNESFSNE